jgi:hypothetical protein
MKRIGVNEENRLNEETGSLFKVCIKWGCAKVPLQALIGGTSSLKNEEEP